MKKLSYVQFRLIGIMLCQFSTAHADLCDEFVAELYPAMEKYREEHRIYPVSNKLKRLAVNHMPQLYVHPESWQPINFNDYLAQSKLLNAETHEVAVDKPTIEGLKAQTYSEQCNTYLKAAAKTKITEAPAVYIQLYRDKSPIVDSAKWLYIKYNYVFDWSGLAKERSFASNLGLLLSGGESDKWHRLDVHTAAILAFDEKFQLRTLTLAQHNHQQTFVAGKDFNPANRIALAAAYKSNELYLDRGSYRPVSYRVVSYYTDIKYLIDQKQKPWIWGIDWVYGKNAGGKLVNMLPVFIEPDHPLATYAGLLAPPKRVFGYYVGRDGPPGYDYYSPSTDVSLVNFIILGYWQEGNFGLLKEIEPLFHDKDSPPWKKLISVMKYHLSTDLISQKGMSAMANNRIEN